MSGPSPPSAPSAPTLAPGSGAPNYIPANQPGIDQAYQNLFSSLQSGAQGLTQFGIPSVYNYAQAITQNPYAGGAFTGAQQGSQYALGTQIPALESAGQALTGGAQQLMTQAFDPQTVLYNRLQQQTLDQAAAANAMAGVSGPYAAGTTDQALQNFNIAWKNQQLGRETQAAPAISGLYGAGLGYTGQVPGTMTGATALPYTTYSNLYGTQPLAAIGNVAQTVGQLYNPTTAAMGSALNYLGQGTGASGQLNTAINQNYANQIAAYNAQQQAAAQTMQGLGSLGGAAFDVASNPLSLFGSSMWGGGGAGMIAFPF